MPRGEFRDEQGGAQRQRKGDDDGDGSDENRADDNRRDSKLAGVRFPRLLGEEVPPGLVQSLRCSKSKERTHQHHDDEHHRTTRANDATKDLVAPIANDGELAWGVGLHESVSERRQARLLPLSNAGLVR